MAAEGKRVYTSELRARQARATRKQIVDAAARLFADRGFAATTVDAVAEEAGVSRKTVFTSVGGKVALLKLACDFALGGDDEEITLRERPALLRIINEPDPWRRNDLYAAFVTETNRRTAKLWLALHEAASQDAEAAAILAEWEGVRRNAMRSGPVAGLQRDGALRDGLSPGQAADIMWLLIDPTVYDRMVNRAGWSRRRFRDWLAFTMRTQTMRARERGGDFGVHEPLR